MGRVSRAWTVAVSRVLLTGRNKSPYLTKGVYTLIATPLSSSAYVNQWEQLGPEVRYVSHYNYFPTS